MQKANEQYAYLTFTGDFDPKAITDRLQLSPSETSKRGSLNERTKRENTFSRWSLRSRLERSAPLEDHIRDVLVQAENSSEAIKSLESAYPLMQAVKYFRDYYPGFHLDKETITKLARLGLEIDCDFYFDWRSELWPPTRKLRDLGENSKSNCRFLHSAALRSE